MCSVARSEHPYYRDASYQFFIHISELIEKTLTYLEDLPNRLSPHPVIQKSTRQKLKLLRKAWGLLHRYIKPCLDADALHTPLPLIDVLGDRVQQLPACQNFEYAVFQMAEMNYAMLTYNEVNSVANKIARIVKGKDFPSVLSLIGIPYSQSSALFLNCSLPHEMAHFVFQEVMARPISNKIDEILASNNQIPNVSSDAVLQTLSEVRDLLNIWVEEIFCDLLAISIVGPAFTFAFAELTSASLIPEESGDLTSTSFEFGPSHPANVARFYLHMRYLQELGWWEYLQTWQPSSIDLLTNCAAVYQRATLSTAISPDARQQIKLKYFWDTCDWLLAFLKSQLPSPQEDIRSMESHYKTIADYLSRAIVPSTIVTDEGHLHPAPVVLINSAFRFVLEDSQKLLDNIEQPDANLVQKRSWYTERLELWILKALEDIRLLNLSKEAS